MFYDYEYNLLSISGDGVCHQGCSISVLPIGDGHDGPGLQEVSPGILEAIVLDSDDVDVVLVHSVV